ncbi:RNA-directed DNA polymerase, eukaryota, reverse transcriptase zinc-binding domain protein [Tanacetum coccineum]
MSVLDFFGLSFESPSSAAFSFAVEAPAPLNSPNWVEDATSYRVLAVASDWLILGRSPWFAGLNVVRCIVDSNRSSWVAKTSRLWSTCSGLRPFSGGINRAQASSGSKQGPLYARHDLGIHGLGFVIVAIGKKLVVVLVGVVDFDKAFDSVGWGYLFKVMKYMGFNETWIQWIRTCLTSSRSSILVNGSLTNEFSPLRGLRQGDPMSPFLFIMVMEGLNVAMKDAVQHGLFRSLKINLHKSKLYGVGVMARDVEDRAIITGCSTADTSFKYLGILVGSDMNRSSIWDDMIQKVHKRLETWKGGDQDDKKISWVQWKKVLNAREKGGLGIGSLKALNLALI